MKIHAKIILMMTRRRLSLSSLDGKKDELGAPVSVTEALIKTMSRDFTHDMYVKHVVARSQDELAMSADSPQRWASGTSCGL